MNKKKHVVTPFYARIKPVNKLFLYRKMRKEGGTSMSKWLDQYLDKLRKAKK